MDQQHNYLSKYCLHVEKVMEFRVVDKLQTFVEKCNLKKERLRVLISIINNIMCGFYTFQKFTNYS